MKSLRSRALRGVCVASVLVASGCANSNFRWVEGPPSAPGSDDAQSPATTAGRSTASQQQPPAVSPDPFSPEQRQRITLVEPWVTQAAREHGLDPALVHGVIWVESRHQVRAKSSAGARGLMQLMPATANAMARQMGRARARVYDAEFNIMAGSMYLARQSKRYDGDVRLALAAYNAGAGNVDKWLARDGELPPNSLRYVELVMDAKRRFEARLSPPPVTRPVNTMLAKADEPPAVVPAPPAPADDDGVYYDEELGAVPRHVVVAPEPSATTEPPPEPPLADTPYPPNADEVFATPATADPATHTDTPAPRAAEAQPAAAGLPGVLD